MSIRYKMFLAMSVLILLAAGTAVYGVRLVTSSSALVVRLYDGPLMAINHARAAQLNFSEARRAIEKSIAMREAATAANFAFIDKSMKQFASDLGIVRERMANADTFNEEIDKLLVLVDAWYKKSMSYLRPPVGGVTELLLPEFIINDSRAIGDAIDQIVENTSAYGFNFRSDAEAAASNSKTSLIVLASATLLIGFVLALSMAASLTRPLRALIIPLDEISIGNFAVEVPGIGRKDEIGHIARAVASMEERVRAIIAEIKASAREVSNATAEISTSTTDLSQRTEEQAASLEETSSSMEQISSTVKKNAENAQQANQSAAVTREVADRGGAVVAKAVGAMTKIEKSSRKISDIIGVIDEIARQTNLLALNAAVEAARAGDAGRGFAVVASEVRSLAQRSSQAAKDIKDLITNSNSQVKDGVELVNQAGAALNEIVESIKTVATIVSEIANASMEQSTGIEQVNKALTHIDEMTQQNSALVEENAATAKTLEHQAKAMDEQVAFFQIDNDDNAVVQDAPPERPISKEPVAAGQPLPKRARAA